MFSVRNELLGKNDKAVSAEFLPRDFSTGITVDKNGFRIELSWGAASGCGEEKMDQS